MASFMLDVKETQNHTWQGSITWIEGKQKLGFRSAIELLDLIDSVVGEDAVKEIFQKAAEEREETKQIY